jgi:hypothetical protein
MREDDLRRALLIQAIEDSDRDGTLVPAADRLAASREAKRAVGGSDRVALLAHRSRALSARVIARYPFLQGVLALARGAWLGWVLIVLGLLAGAALSALDGTRRINVLAFPLLGLVAWNLGVYVLVAVRPRARTLPTLAARSAMGRLSALIARSRAFNAPLAAALKRFASDWQAAARPLLVARAARAFHLAAAAVGIGLIAGLYLRGVAFDYHAGWESTFLDAERARTVLAVIYGPASLLTGIGIPDAAGVEAIRWSANGGGEPAANWIHLLAATALIFVVIPRLALAAWEAVSVARRSRDLPWPDSLDAHFREAFAPVGVAIDRGIAMVVAYAHDLPPEGMARLREWLPGALGGELAIDVRETVRYGEEEAFVKNLGEHGGEIADRILLLMSAAATPEDENHGVLVDGARDWIAQWRPRAKLVVLIDEGPYAVRMDTPGGSIERLEERRRAWTDFVAARGVEARFADFSR